MKTFFCNKVLSQICSQVWQLSICMRMSLYKESVVFLPSNVITLSRRGRQRYTRIWGQKICWNEGILVSHFCDLSPTHTFFLNSTATIYCLECQIKILGKCTSKRSQVISELLKKKLRNTRGSQGCRFWSDSSVALFFNYWHYTLFQTWFRWSIRDCTKIEQAKVNTETYVCWSMARLFNLSLLFSRVPSVWHSAGRTATPISCSNAWNWLQCYRGCLTVG